MQMKLVACSMGLDERIEGKKKKKYENVAVISALRSSTTSDGIISFYCPVLYSTVSRSQTSRNVEI